MSWGSIERYMEALDFYRRTRCFFERQVTPKEYGMYLANKKHRKSKGKKKRR